ncbi:MAG TPA: thiamine phosphate synthase, partial [Bryobacteraceae bacterium]|nr:thiamine phosphate synthase [Bryobacteraceae bacterium]
MILPRFYPILDTQGAERRGIDPLSAAGQILEGGAKILQFRHKGFFSRGVFETMQKAAALCREAGAIFIVNDRADLARILEAGLHLGQDDLPPSAIQGIVG